MVNLLRIRRMEHGTNEEENGMERTKTIIIDGILQRRLTFHGHTERNQHCACTDHRVHRKLHLYGQKDTWLKELDKKQTSQRS